MALFVLVAGFALYVTMHGELPIYIGFVSGASSSVPSSNSRGPTQ